MIKITFDEERCKGCGLCQSVCPKGIIAIKGTINNKGYSPYCLTDESACIGCGSCATTCPDLCIRIEEI